jgi:hypothetical protein
MVQVTQAELDRIAADLGLPPGSSVEAMLARGNELRAAREAQEAANAQAREVTAAQRYQLDDDKRIVAAAINAGKIPVDRQAFWLETMARDRVNTRKIVASLSPGLPPAQRVVEDDSLERTHSAVLGRLGVAADKPRPIAAAAPPVPPSYTPQKFDSAGLTLPQMPKPVQLSTGKPREEWTQQERSNEFMHALGGRFAAAAPPPPRGPSYYIPTGNDVTLPQVDASGDVHWVENPDYRPMSGD